MMNHKVVNSCIVVDWDDEVENPGRNSTADRKQEEGITLLLHIFIKDLVIDAACE